MDKYIAGLLHGVINKFEDIADKKNGDNLLNLCKEVCEINDTDSDKVKILWITIWFLVSDLLIELETYDFCINMCRIKRNMPH